MNTPGTRLKTARQLLKVNMEEFGQPLGVSRSIVSLWESGKSELPKAMSIAIEAIYHISANWLLAGEGTMWAMPTPDPTKARSVMDLPVLSVPVFQSDGETLEVEPNVERYPLATSSLKSMIQNTGAGTEGTFFFFRAQEDGWSIQKRDLVLVNTALSLRTKPATPYIHLLRLVPGTVALRRLMGPAGALSAATPAGDFDLLPNDPLLELVLGRVCTWIHIVA